MLGGSQDSMGLTIYSLALNDACWFLNQAKASLDIPRNRQTTLRYLRATVLFCWVALEQMLDSAIEEYVVQGKLLSASIPKRLRDRLEIALAVNGRMLDRSDFKQYRDLRNDVAHNDTEFCMSDVQGSFDVCLETIRAFYPCRIEVTWEDVTRG